MRAKKKSVTLYLAGWQKRMIMDFTGISAKKRLTRIVVARIPKKEWVMYRQPFEVMKAGQWNLYLTDEQIRIVRDKLGVRAKVSALNISPKLLKSGEIAFK